MAWFAGRDSDGAVYTFPGAKSGNRIYSYRLRERVENALCDLDVEAGNCLFITLTASYIKTEKGITASWKKNSEELPRCLRKLRALGFASYIWVREAHEDGGCHVHLIAKKPGPKFRYFRDKENPDILRLDDEVLRAAIKKAWPSGHVDVQVISTEGAGGYLAKELGKASHIENALARAEKGEGTAADSKKLWAHYMAAKTKMRRWGVSRDLIKHMNNPTDEPEPEPEEFIMLSEKVKKSDWFEPITGPLEPGSRAFREISALLDSRKAAAAAVWESLKDVPKLSLAAVLGV